jgi:two-component system, cell cycle sensor histidine kinase and response regulator CckA
MIKRADSNVGMQLARRAPQLPDIDRAIVLFVSGDDDLRTVAARVLGREGFLVVTAAHAGHAVLAGLTLDRIDLLISEMVLDDMPGPALAERLRRHHAGLRTLFMADYGTPEGDGLLVRPFTRDHLLAALASLAAAATSPAS